MAFPDKTTPKKYLNIQPRQATFNARKEPEPVMVERAQLYGNWGGSGKSKSLQMMEQIINQLEGKGENGQDVRKLVSQRDAAQKQVKELTETLERLSEAASIYGSILEVKEDRVVLGTKADTLSVKKPTDFECKPGMIVRLASETMQLYRMALSKVDQVALGVLYEEKVKDAKNVIENAKMHLKGIISED